MENSHTYTPNNPYSHTGRGKINTIYHTSFYLDMPSSSAKLRK